MGFFLQAVFFLIAFAFFTVASVAQTIERRSVMWVAPTSETLSLHGYEVKEETESDSIRKEYIRRAEDRRWIPFYTCERYVLVTLGHRKNLINMKLIYISVPAEQRELANRLNSSYKNWWYVVDSANGRVLREYRSTLPRKWWT